ncbi:MAG: fused MFS/spermidine synthase [Desulfuromonadales bacterium]|nr:fused MFS/spermidine synthase [Desulfuromonadales bacterium]
MSSFQGETMGELGGRHKVIIFLIFSLSGFSALVYEVLWTKHLSLAFGTTMTAVSVVTATFMAGLALGSYLLGKFSDRNNNLLRIYAYLELGIAAFALLFTSTLELASTFHIALAQFTPNLTVFNHIAHIVVAVLLLLPPTLCMGGTFPIMCRFFARKKSGGQIGRLYALNTLGASIGAFLSGYYLIPQLGLFNTNLLAVTFNLVIAAIAWHYSRESGHASVDSPAGLPGRSRSNLIQKHRLVLIASAMIGFFSLSYEILWTRVFMLFLGNTSYAFSLMLSSFLISIALGGALYSRIIHPAFNEKQLFVRLTLLMGLAVLLTAPCYDQLAHLFLRAHALADGHWWLLSLLSGVIVFAIICVPIIISGALLPAAIAILDPGKLRTGEGVGLVVLHNTTGAVLGSLVAGFLLIPSIGIQSSFQGLALVNVLLGATLLLAFSKASRAGYSQAALVCMGGLLLAFASPRWDQGLMNSGVYIYAAKYLAAGGIDKVLQSEKILEVIEGLETTVAIHESNDGQVRFFTVNGKTDGGIGRDMATQALVGQLPLLLHPEPRDVLVVGLGTGITLSGLSSHPTESIKCVEISPEVVAASHYFDDSNQNALVEEKVSLLINDGRNLLLTEKTQYDVIISEPSNPWQSGNCNLFTDEFYQLAASRLKTGGLFAQWIGLYDITSDNLRIAVNTLLKTFPEALAFRTGSDLILVGGHHQLQFDYLGLQQRMARPGVRDTLQAIGISSPGELIARHYLFDEASLQEFSRGAGLNSDNLPVLEYSARYLLGQKTLGGLQMENISALHQSSSKMTLPLTNLGRNTQSVANALRELGDHYLGEGRTNTAQQLLLKARTLEEQKDSSG